MINIDSLPPTELSSYRVSLIRLKEYYTLRLDINNIATPYDDDLADANKKITDLINADVPQDDPDFIYVIDLLQTLQQQKVDDLQQKKALATQQLTKIEDLLISIDNKFLEA